MVILTANGFQNKENCSELKKLLKNKKVYICTNAINQSFYKNQAYNLIKENMGSTAIRIDGGDLNIDNAYRYCDYYDCIYITSGNLRLLSETICFSQVKESLLKFVNRGKLLLIEGNSSLIAVDNLDYINQILKSLTQDLNDYPSLNYSALKTLSLTNEKVVVDLNHLPKQFKGACKLAEKNLKTSFSYIKENEFIIF